jgi:1-acyl-sn-glycerol-3-phosphate acyltransferase
VSETKQNARLLELIDRAIRQTEALHPGLRITCFGAPAIAVTNAKQIKKDSVLAIALSLVLILALLIYFFRNARNIALIFFSVLFGWLFALALLSLFADSISIIAVGISSVFIGIAINYPLHLIDHVGQQTRVKQALKEIIPPLLIGNITTVGAFLSLVFIPSNAMRDMGWFGSLLLVGTMLFVLIYLPHWVKARPLDGRRNLPFARLAMFSPERKKWILWPVLLLSLCFLYFSQYTTFESDMHSINYMTDQQRDDMADMLQSVEHSEHALVWFISEGTSLNDALAAYERHTPLLDSLQQAGDITRISGIGVFMASQEEQQRRIRLWDDFWDSRRETLCRRIEDIATEQGFKPGSFHPFTQLLHTTFEPHDPAYFAPIAELLADNYLINDSVTNRTMVVNLLYCEQEKAAGLEATLRSAAVGAHSFDTRNIAQRMVDALSGNFNYVLYVCACIVFLFLTLSFGRLELSLLAFLPLALSWVWILGIMQLGDMRFNIVNIILATFIFGQGDDYTIFITEGLMYEYTYRRKMLASYKNSIILSALIMFVGIGTLIFAQHPALKSLAQVTIVGMLSVVLMACILPPLLFRWLTKTKDGFREQPLTLSRLLRSLYAFTAFLLGSCCITLCGIALLGWGKRTEGRKMRYHSVLRWTAAFVIRRIPGVRFHYRNRAGETFDKPAVIISNHQSHLDLMCLLMLTPRLVILTNDWVWNNPFYGRLIKYADFYPASNGLAACIDKLSQRVSNGYSILVFPEGTRSEGNTILRFHRGAFYLAETLGLDVLPVFIHGAGHVLPKKDFMLREGAITVEVHPRISAQDSNYSNDYPTRTKQIQRYYRQTFATLRREQETAAYFTPFVLHNYYYKGVQIEYAVRRILTKTHSFAQWIDSADPQDGKVLVVNNGYGIFSFLFALVHKQAQVVAIDRDADKVALARACTGLPPNLSIYEASELLPATNPSLAFNSVYMLQPDELQRVGYSDFNPHIIETNG